MGLLYAVIWKQPVSRGLAYGVTTGVVLLIPLGVYWSMLQVTEGVISFISSVWRWLRQPHVAP